MESEDDNFGWTESDFEADELDVEETLEKIRFNKKPLIGWTRRFRYKDGNVAPYSEPKDEQKKILSKKVFSAINKFISQMVDRSIEDEARTKGENGERQIRCYICHYLDLQQTKFCALPSDLRDHIVNKHLTVRKRDLLERPHKCEYCGKSFARNNGRKVHIKTQHRNEVVEEDLNKKIEVKLRQITCEICGKIFGSQINLENHLSKHTGEKCHRCSVCGVRFSTSTSLITHYMGVHGVTKKQWESCRICRFCGEKFVKVQDCEKHVIDEHCDELGWWRKEFNSKTLANRKLYRLIKENRTDEALKIEVRTSMCSYCGKEYALPRSLRRHLAKQHKVRSGDIGSCRFCSMPFNDPVPREKHIISEHQDQLHFMKPQLELRRKLVDRALEDPDCLLEEFPLMEVEHVDVKMSNVKSELPPVSDNENEENFDPFSFQNKRLQKSENANNSVWEDAFAEDMFAEYEGEAFPIIKEEDVDSMNITEEPKDKRRGKKRKIKEEIDIVKHEIEDAEDVSEENYEESGVENDEKDGEENNDKDGEENDEVCEDDLREDDVEDSEEKAEEQMSEGQRIFEHAEQDFAAQNYGEDELIKDGDSIVENIESEPLSKKKKKKKKKHKELEDLDESHFIETPSLTRDGETVKKKKKKDRVNEDLGESFSQISEYENSLVDNQENTTLKEVTKKKKKKKGRVNEDLGESFSQISEYEDSLVHNQDDTTVKEVTKKKKKKKKNRTHDDQESFSQMSQEGGCLEDSSEHENERAKKKRKRRSGPDNDSSERENKIQDFNIEESETVETTTTFVKSHENLFCPSSDDE